MSFTRVKPTGWTNDVDTVTAPQLNALDVNQSRAIDGTGGGTYSPSVVLVIQGSAGLKIDGSGSAARLQYGSRSLSRAQSSLLWNVTTDAFSAGVSIVGANETAVQMFDRIPNGATLTGVSVYINRTDTGVLPTTRCTVTLRKRSAVTGTGSVITGPTEDSTAVLASYEAHHPITISGLAEVVDTRTTTYWLDFAGETGSNTSTVLLYPCIVTYTVTDQDEAP